MTRETGEAPTPMSTKTADSEPIEEFTDEELAQYLRDQMEEIEWAVIALRDDLGDDHAARVLRDAAGELATVGEELLAE